MDIAFHIGYHKTASSWLQQVYFPAHPAIAMIADSANPWDDPMLRCLIATSDRKFNSHLCSDVLNQKIVALEMRGGGKCVSLVSAERLSGHPISGGFDSFRIAERIHCVAPEARIVMVIREQIKMISSVYKQMVSEGYPGRFDDMLHSRNWKTVGFDPGFYEYDILIDKYHSLFGRHNVLVLPYELMCIDSGEFVRQLCSFLDVAVIDPPKNEQTINRSLPASRLNVIRFMNRFRRSELNPYPVFNIPEKMRKLLMKLIAVALRKSAVQQHFMTDEQRVWIADYYKESNERLSKLVGIDFSDYPGSQQL